MILEPLERRGAAALQDLAEFSHLLAERDHRFY
jgi:hypothetical protein